jgi:iron(III) transport system substrate-binding protein
MRSALPALLLLTGILGLAACAPSRAALPAPAAAPLGAADDSRQQEWNALVAAAQAERKVAVHGPPSDEVRKAVTEPFQARYGIAVEYLGLPGAEFLPRIEAERAGGKYLWDVFLGGSNVVFQHLGRLGAVEPIDPFLLLPEVKDPRNWNAGTLPYFDSKRLGLTFVVLAQSYLYANTRLVSSAELTNWRTLLNPKWKGQIVFGRDPRTIGYTQATFHFFYLHKDLGPEFIRDLLRHEPQILRRDDILSAQWLAQGRYPLCLCSNIEGDNMAKEGLPVRQVTPQELREGAGITSSYGNIAVFHQAPHPNATKVFTNWLLSQEGQTLFSQATLFPSTRVDVPTAHINPARIPQPGWVVVHGEDGINEQESMLALLEEILGKQ